jgi:hypothetical protein
MPTIEGVRKRLREDTPYYAEHALQIVDVRKKLVPLRAKPAQARFDAALERQRQAGQPQRAIVLKARKLGFSTWTQAKMIQHTTQNPNVKALVIAHDDATVSELFGIGFTMYVNLPAELQPPLKYGQKGESMEFGERTRLTGQDTHGHNSSIRTQTARNFEAGRGFTLHDVHCSEVAFWPDIERKLTAILNAVPDVEDTMIVLESTANGFNYFKELWDQAEAGESDFVPVFFPWFEEPDYVRPFASAEERVAFEATVGDPPYGEDEPRLLEKFLTNPELDSMEQLAWRRWAIRNKCGNNLRKFQQEYPAEPREAFLATGRHVFEPSLLQVIFERVDETDPRIPSPAYPGPERGTLEPTGVMRMQGRAGPIDVPRAPEWVPRASGSLVGSPWRVWEHPTPAVEGRSNEPVQAPGAYVIGVDVSGGELEERDVDKPAFHAIEVVDHRTRRQVAEYRSRVDHDLLAREVLLAALYYNEAWVAVEVTGGYGIPVARILRRDYRFRRMFYRRSVDRAIHERREDRLGWDTNSVTKPLLEEHAVKLVREGIDGVRSRTLATEMLTYVKKDTRGRSGPESGKFADCLMAWMIAQHVAQESHIVEAGFESTTAPGHYSIARVRDPVTGY